MRLAVQQAIVVIGNPILVPSLLLFGGVADAGDAQPGAAHIARTGLADVLPADAHTSPSPTAADTGAPG